MGLLLPNNYDKIRISAYPDLESIDRCESPPSTQRCLDRDLPSAVSVGQTMNEFKGVDITI